MSRPNAVVPAMNCSEGSMLWKSISTGKSLSEALIIASTIYTPGHRLMRIDLVQNSTKGCLFFYLIIS